MAAYQDPDVEVQDEDIITITPDNKIWSLHPAREHPTLSVTTPTRDVPQELVEKYSLKSLPVWLDSGKSEVFVLVSTKSGTGLALAFLDDVLLPLLGAIGLKEGGYKIVRTENTESVSNFAREVLLPNAKSGKQQTVLLLSGDGGIVEIINGLFSGVHTSYVKPLIGLLPLGTGNALFHSIHKPSKLPSPYIQALRTLLQGTPKPLPTFKASFSPGATILTNEGQTATPIETMYGAVVASYGFHATLVADSDTTEYRKQGAARFGAAARDLLSPAEGPHAYQANLTLTTPSSSSEIPAPHGYILATLVSNLEKTFTISPDSTPLDRQLRIVQFGALNAAETLHIMGEAYKDGQHTAIESVRYEPISALKIDFDEEEQKWNRCCIDGLIVAVKKGGWMKVETVEEGAEAVDILS